MSKNNLQILDYSDIQKSVNGKEFRILKFKDIANSKQVDYHLYATANKLIWSELKDCKKTNKSPRLYNGHIENYEGLNIVVFSFQTAEKAFEYQKWKLDGLQKISWKQVLKMQKDSEGFKTDLNKENSFTPGWLEIPKKAKKIKYRYYKGRQGFTWSKWFIIK